MLRLSKAERQFERIKQLLFQLPGSAVQNKAATKQQNPFSPRSELLPRPLVISLVEEQNGLWNEGRELLATSFLGDSLEPTFPVRQQEPT